MTPFYMEIELLLSFLTVSSANPRAFRKKGENAGEISTVNTFIYNRFTGDG